MKSALDIGYANGQKLDWYFPDEGGWDTIVYFHGGGLEAGDKADFDYREIAADFVRSGYGFVSVNYRMYSSGARFPDFIKDAAAAVAYVRANSAQHGGNGKIYVAGQSAGGWIALMLCLDRRYLKEVGAENAEIAGWIIDSAQTTSHFNVIRYETGADPRRQIVDEYAPLYFVDENTKFSKMLLIFYEDDMPCRPEQNFLFMRAVREFNPQAQIEYVRLPGLHCSGSGRKDRDGRYPFVKESLKWLEGAERK